MAIITPAGTISSSGGKIVIPNNFSSPGNPAFHAYRNAGHISSGSTQIIFNGTTLNRGNHYNTSTGFFTAPIDGIYWFYVWTMDVSGSTQRVNDYIRLQKNSSGTDELRIYTSQNGASRTQRSGGYIINMSAGDTMRVYNQNATIYGVSYVYCYFSGCLLG